MTERNGRGRSRMNASRGFACILLNTKDLVTYDRKHKRAWNVL